ncbi:MAG TPA: DNA translocase FtsK 4TM domain-containing protein [Kofleriaceae bacterium]|nr:DNA translocase FtsK 4TM domain-containing protein [Kofleriaceae bacterium]
MPRKPTANRPRRTTSPEPRRRMPAPEPRRRAHQESAEDGRGLEVTGIAGLGLALFLILALASFQAHATLMGPFGNSAAHLTYGLFGLCAYVVAALMAVVAVRAILGFALVRPREAAGVGLAMVAVAVVLHIFAAGYRVAGMAPGGLVGENIAEILRALISTAGTVLLAATALIIAAVIATPLRLGRLTGMAGMVGRFVWAHLVALAAEVAAFCGDVIKAVLPERDAEQDEVEIDGDEDIEDEVAVDDEVETEAAEEPVAKPKKRRARKSAPPEDASPVSAIDAAPTVANSAAPVSEINAGDTEKLGDDEMAAITGKAAGKKPEPLIVESQFLAPKKRDLDAASRKVDKDRAFIPVGGDYKLPPIHLLSYDENQASALDRQAMLELSARLAKTLEDYGVKGEVTAIRPGPVVTMYEFAPAPGTRVSKIANLNDDLAMALEALRVRIVAPIPGKAVVGIEVPNKVRETVYLKEILADDSFQSNKVKLPLALGKDIEGAPSVVDLAKMPHLLVAGTTGSGKSVSVNSMITSLLYDASPDDVRMIMVDPKMLELSIYDGIPHLLLPVVTDPKKANLALRWAVEEMERRYDLLAQMAVRDIATYNRKLEKQLAAKAVKDAEQALADAEAAAEGDVDVAPSPVTDDEPPPTKLPYIVVIIDEFADLMMCAPKEVETSVARIAQKARAAGIHLILATQRPSVDVITGLIKANFPSRIAFHVTAKVDSRTILDQSGAEALLGAGDMLFSDRGAAPTRLHGCFVDEEEIGRVVAFLKEQGKPVYNLDILRPRDEEGGDDPESDEPVDEMYDRAVALVAESRQASISMIQRRLRVGYNRAARMVEHMEREGVVGPPDNTNRREVLISPAA